MATSVKDLLGKSGGSAYPNTSVKLKQKDGKVGIKSVKSPKFNVGDRLNLK